MRKILSYLSVLLLCMAVVFTSCGTWNKIPLKVRLSESAEVRRKAAGVGALAGNTALGSIIGAAVGGTGA